MVAMARDPCSDPVTRHLRGRAAYRMRRRRMTIVTPLGRAEGTRRREDIEKDGSLATRQAKNSDRVRNTMFRKRGEGNPHAGILVVKQPSDDDR